MQLTAFSAALDIKGQLFFRQTAAVAYLTASDFIGCYTGAMANVTEAELVEMVPGLRAMASVEVSGEVREALTRLAAIDPQQSQLVEARFFGGLTIDETAELFQISAATVGREWTLAKAWLYAELAGTRS